jgi:hypothetical protein
MVLPANCVSFIDLWSSINGIPGFVCKKKNFFCENKDKAFNVGKKAYIRTNIQNFGENN